MIENCGKHNSLEKNKDNKPNFKADLLNKSKVRKVIVVVSGKGGVGKSLVTSLMAINANRLGFKSGILDADITGPSIPKLFGISEKAKILSDDVIIPTKSKTGIDIMSINLLLENEKDPVVWRGPIIANTVKQFWSNVIWDDIDFLFVDMPPGTGDVPLTVFQSIPIDGIIVVTSPQELVSMIVSKAVKMAEMMDVKILGIVENMTYFKCPDNGKEYEIFGKSHLKEISSKYQLKILAKLPLDPKISKACDLGKIEEVEDDFFGNVLKEFNLEEKLKMKIAIASEAGQVTEHFGHCKEFSIFEVEDGKVISSQTIDNPGHKPGFLPNYLNDLGVNVIISGGMGSGAISIFNEKNIEVIVGASGKNEDLVESYLVNELKSTGSVCHQHLHQDECGE